VSGAGQDRPIKIVGVGPLPPPVGGTTVSFPQLQEALAELPGVSVETINTNGIRGRGVVSLVLFPWMLFRIFAAARRSDVIALHCSSTALHIVGILAVLCARLARRPIVIRKFGGSDYTDLASWKQRLAHFAVSHADLYLLQTKNLMARARARGIERVAWFPTSRPFDPSAPPAKPQCRRFVFLGAVEEAKGIRLIIASDGRLGEDVVVDVYGVLGRDISARDFEGCRQVFYRGILFPEQVPAVLADHDALLLPTFYSGEGYPGAIIEAYAAGLPVICTRWMDLPELVDESSGILIEPRSAAALVEAMRRLTEDDAEYARVCAGALARRGEFSLCHWAGRFVDYCREAAHAG